MELHLLILFLKGMAIGFVGAMPLGPLGLICIRRTLQSGFLPAFIGGFGTAMADAFFGIVSAFGLTVISKFMHEMETPLRIVAGIFMLAMGAHVWRSKPKELSTQDMPQSYSHMGNMASNFFITVTNPLTIVFFTIAFASLGLAENQTMVTGSSVVLGIFSGSMLMWFVLAGAITLKRNSKLLSNMLWINRMTAVVLLSCGVWALAGLFVKL